MHACHAKRDTDPMPGAETVLPGSSHNKLRRINEGGPASGRQHPDPAYPGASAEPAQAEEGRAEQPSGGREWDKSINSAANREISTQYSSG